MKVSVDFGSASLELLFPLSDKKTLKDLISSPQREYILNDECLHGYALLKLDQLPDIISKDEFKKLCCDITLQVEAYGTLLSQPQQGPPPPPPIRTSSFNFSNSKLKTLSINSLNSKASRRDKDSDLNLKRDWDDFFVFSYIYDPSHSESSPIPYYEKKCCLYPLNIPVGNMKRGLFPDVSLSISVSAFQGSVGEEVIKAESQDHFDVSSLLEGLEEALDVTPQFEHPKKGYHFLTLKKTSASNISENSAHSKNQPKNDITRISAHKVLAVKDALVVRAKSVLLPNSEMEHCIILSLHLTPEESMGKIVINSISVEVHNAVISQLDSGKDASEPITLKPKEEVAVLYSLSFFEELKQPLRSKTLTDKVPDSLEELNITISATPLIPGTHNQSIISKWNLDIDKTTMIDQKARKLDTANEDIILTFSVEEVVYVRKLFTVWILITNRSKLTQHFCLIVPNSRDAHLSSRYRGQNDDISKINMKSREFIDYFSEHEARGASIIALDNCINLRPLLPFTCQRVGVKYLAVRENLHSVGDVKLVDSFTGREAIVVKDALEVVVRSPNYIEK